MMPRLSGYEVCRALREKHPLGELPVLFLVILDVMMPRMSGFEVCRELRRHYPLEPDTLCVQRQGFGLMRMDEDWLPGSRLDRDTESSGAEHEGLLPICAGCKKIRDDEDRWNALEIYIDRHSEAQFSHGLCPDCVARYRSRQDRSGSE